MKKVTLLATVLLALAMTASAQQMIDFTQLAPASTPTPVPEGYAGLHWGGIDYVAPLLWSYSNGSIETGDGFTTGPEAQVSFGGGPLCYKKHGGNTSSAICIATISAGIGPNALTQFRPDYAVVSEGWSSDGSQSIVVDAYNDGVKVGSQKFDLQTNAQKFKLVFPNSWGAVTELMIHPSPGGSFVLYVLGLK